jgi:hypothetical protein
LDYKKPLLACIHVGISAAVDPGDGPFLHFSSILALGDQLTASVVGKIEKENYMGRRTHCGGRTSTGCTKPCGGDFNAPPREGGAWLLWAPICGWAVYLLLMHKWTDNAFEGFEAQKQFHMQSIRNVLNVSHSVSTLITPTNFHEIFGSGLDRCSSILLVYTLPIIWRLDKGWLMWSLLLGVVPAMSGMFVSYTRFASVVFPLFVVMAVYFNKP